MKLAGYHLISDADLTAMIRAGAMALAERRAASITKRYARNEECLKAAFAARNRLPLPVLFCADGVLDKERVAIEAFADAMGRERGEEGRAA